jgi:hypothetical protein
MTEHERRPRERSEDSTRTILILDRLAANPDPGELLAAHPELTLDDVKAALSEARAALTRGRTPNPARERRFRRMLAVAKHPEVDGDALLDDLEQEDAARRGGTHV